MPQQLAVVVPVHNFTLEPYEKLGLRRIKKCLGHLPLFLVYPAGKNPPREDWAGFKTIPINRHWGRYGTTTTDSYNQLLRSSYFYELFADYEFILIAQLDTFIFHSDLSYFTSLPYDYWGAPWLVDLYRIYPYLRDLVEPLAYSKIGLYLRMRLYPKSFRFRVGNGGLSLRRVSTFLKLSRDYPELSTKFKQRMETWRERGYNISYEDNYWCLFVPKLLPGAIKIAPWAEALKFSFELGPSLAFKFNHHELPFGTHAWFKHEKEFWLPFIQQIEPDWPATVDR